jgi:tetratricopeptide (TPR) repeat protein
MQYQIHSILTRVVLLSTFTLISFISNAQNEPLERADKLYELHDYKGAAKAYEKIVTTEDDTTHAVARLADSYRHLNNLTLAAAWYERAVKQQGADPITILEYAEVLKMEGKYPQTEAFLKTFKKYDESRADYLLQSLEYAQSNQKKAGLFEVSMSAGSSSGADFFASFNGKQSVVFSSTRQDVKRSKTYGQSDGNGESSNQLFMMKSEGTATDKINSSAPVLYKTDFKNTMNEAACSFSADGHTVAYTRNNIIGGNRISSNAGLELGIYIAKIAQNGDWTDIKSFPFNTSGVSNAFPSLSEDGKTMYFASTRAGGRGGFDIYVSKLEGTNWTDPQNLGAEVNTQGDEITPFVDGNTLYFSSDWQIGFGGYDVFKAERNDNKWGTVSNLGADINTAQDDYAFIYKMEGNIGYLTSNRKGGKGKDDLYFFKKKSETVQIVVLNEADKKVIKDVKMRVMAGDSNMLSHAKGGGWLLDLNNGGSFTLEITKDSLYQPKTITILSNGVKKSRVEEVLLRSRLLLPTEQASHSGQYLGEVKSQADNKPIEGVLVTATNIANSKKTATYTDKMGKFSCALDKEASYLIRYSKEGFVNTNKTIKTTDGHDIAGLIGSLSLKPSVFNGNPADSTKSEPKPVIIADNGNTTPRSPNDKKTFGFSIQLGAQAADKMVDLSKFDDLKPYGKVYAIPESGKTKIRLGVFKNRMLADSVVAKIAATHKGVFVVQENDPSAVKNNLIEKGLDKAIKPAVEEVKDKKIDAAPTVPKKVIKDKETAPKTAGTKTATEDGVSVTLPASYSVKTAAPKNAKADTIPKVKAPRKDEKTFKVRIAAFKDVKNFDGSKLAKIGKTENIQQGKITVVVINGYKTLQDAKDAKAKVKTAGFADAKVVVWEGDNLKVVD